MSDSLAPSDIVAKLIDIGAAKSQHAIADLLIRGSLLGALLGFDASLALLAGRQGSAVTHHPAMSFGKASLTGRQP
jgi:hypothetical protein